MGNAVVCSGARRICHHPRGGTRRRLGRRPRARALGPALHVAASVALVIGSTQIGAAQVAGAAAPSGAHGRHCVAQLGASRPTMHCFATLKDAVAAATNGRLRLPSSTTGAALATMPINSGAAASSDYHVVSIEWTGSNYTGASLTWQTPSPCGSYASSSMPRGWNDTIRSVAQYSGCSTSLFWDVDFGGDSHAFDVNASVPDLGSFDANVSSQKWCPVFSCS
jgi:hypothetical protein